MKPKTIAAPGLLQKAIDGLCMLPKRGQFCTGDLYFSVTIMSGSSQTIAGFKELLQFSIVRGQLIQELISRLFVKGEFDPLFLELKVWLDLEFQS